MATILETDPHGIHVVQGYIIRLAVLFLALALLAFAVGTLLRSVRWMVSW